VVGLIGGLGGFILPIAFGWMNDLVGVATSCFMLLFLIAAVSLLWMHLAILRMERREIPQLAGPQYLPESDVLGPVLPPRPGEPPARGQPAATSSSAPSPIAHGARA
jgi:NNP family nitrate/nitrite transporter-like MFS transporter